MPSDTNSTSPSSSTSKGSKGNARIESIQPTDEEAKKGKYTKLYHLLRQANRSKYEAIDPIPGKIIEGVFIGSIGSTTDLAQLKELGITHVLSVGFGMKNPHAEMRWMGVDIMDTPKTDLLQHVKGCHAFIAEGVASGGVLVHCHQGKSRSCAVVASYLMKTQYLTLEGAMKVVRAGRPVASPNAGFIAQLLKYQRILRMAEPHLYDVPEPSTLRCG